ncbi:MAG: alpha/beta fold hydrolase [Pseudomonadota bacterium]
MNITLATLLLIGGLAMLTALQRQLIYFPERESENALLSTAERIGLRAWRNARGDLIGWRTAPARNADRRIVVFHGNAGHALYRQYFAAGFLALNADWQVYLFEYPGYGARAGTPSESVIKTAAVDALQTLLDEDSQPLFLVGESLGSGVASYLAGHFARQVGGVLLATPFTSLTDVAKQHYGFLPVDTLLSERYDSVAALGDFDGPVAFLIAGNDEVVPAELGRSLHAGFGGPKWLQEQPGAGHNTLNYDPTAEWWREVTRFWLST